MGYTGDNMNQGVNSMSGSEVPQMSGFKEN